MNFSFFKIYCMLFFLFGMQLTFGNNLELSESNLKIHEHEKNTKKNTCKNAKTAIANVAPILNSTGNQIFCPGTPMNIVTDFTIIDPDDTGIDALYIQISSGYVVGEDFLTLNGFHPTIASSWNPLAGKLTLTGSSSQPTYVDLVAAVKDILYSTNNLNPSGIRTFSITVGQANYLPDNGHYYQFIPNIGITWISAKQAAQNSTYYGLQGYLVTISSGAEAQISSKQSAGAGWIGGTDVETEGVWKWVTGPEAGTIFWYGGITGYSPNFAFWNSGEPNQSGDEDYAHITAPTIGTPGAWNDLSNTGDFNGEYQPKGYIVEYGGTPGDPILQISTSTTITIPHVNPTIQVNNCGPGSFTLNATATNGIIKWYQNSTGGIPLALGEEFTTPILTTTTTYYLDAYELSCSTGVRIPFTVKINEIPVVIANIPSSICANNFTTISVTSSSGTVYWYENPIGGNPIGFGNDFTTPPLTQTTIYYAEGDNNGCRTSPRTAVTVQVYQPPLVTDETVVICENSSTVLHAGVENVSYLWSTGAITPNIIVFDPGVYTVTVTSLAPEFCSSTKSITVIENTIPVIEEIVVNGTMATIEVSGNEMVEYSIDNSYFQESNIFNVNTGGQYTAYVRDINGCGEVSQNFIVIVFPKFFTPNNDGYNDFWTVEGMQYYPKSKAFIFDRFGRLLLELNPANPYWNGSYNGKNLSSTDYWFTYSIDDTQPTFRGHFNLKR